MKPDNKYLDELHDTTGSTVLEEQLELASEMLFKYRQEVGELLCVDIPYYLDLIYAVITLSHFSQNPAKI